MKKDLYIDGVHFLTAREAGDVLGYAPDYVSRLCREGKLRGRRSGKTWIVEADSLVPFIKAHEAKKEAWHQNLSRELRSVAEPIAVRDENFQPLSHVSVAPRQLHILRASERAHAAREQAQTMMITRITLSFVLAVLLLFVASVTPLSTPIANMIRGAASEQVAAASFFSPIESIARATYAGATSFACAITGWCDAQPMPVVYVRAPQQPIAQAPAPTQITNNITNYIQPTVGSGVLATGVSEQILESRLNAMENYLTGRIELAEHRGDRQAESLADSFADGIGGGGFEDIDITDSSWSGGSISGASISGSTLSGVTFSGAQAFDALVVADATTTNATSSNLYVSGSFGFGSGTGLMRTVGGAASTLPNGSNGQVLKMVGGNLQWSTDLTGGGGGGASFFASTTDDLAIYPADPDDVVIIGDSATSTVGNILEIVGDSLFRGAMTSYGTMTAPRFTATSSTASVFPYASTTAISANSLCISGDCRQAWPDSAFSTSSADYWQTQRTFFSTTSADYYKSINNFFSTSSADYWKTANNFFSTTSADAWKDQRNFFSTTSAAYFLSQNQGAAFSTTSAQYFLVQNGALGFSTTSSDYWMTQRNFFSTSSADYYKSVNNFFSTSSASYFASLGLAFSTTSNDYWKSVNNFFSTSSADYYTSVNNFFSTTSADAWKLTRDFFSTTSASYFLSQNQSLGFSTTSANYFAASSTTIPKTYAANTFIALQTFGNASTSILSANTICLSTDCRTSWPSFTDTSFSTTSADYWKTQNDFFSTTSTSYFLAQNQGAAFSTTSAGYLLSSYDKGFFFSTTSANYFLSQQGSLGFSTTSSDYWMTQRDFFSTTSADFWKTANNFFSTSSADYWSSTKNFSTFGYLFPNNATTTGLMLLASTTIGNGTAAGGLTVSGTATTSRLVVSGTGTSTFAGDILMSGSIIPSADNTYSLGSESRMWKDVYIGPGSLYVNGKKVIEDVSDTITISTDDDQNLMSETGGVGNNTMRANGSGNLNLLSGSGNINITSTSGNINLGTGGSGQLNLGIIASGTWQGMAIADNYLVKSGNWTGTLDGYEAAQLLGGSFATSSADYWKTANDFFSTTSADYWGSTKGYATFGYLFPNNATTTKLDFNAGASTTQFTATGSTYLATGGGNVGIGTTSPSQKLDIWGNLNVATGTTPALFVNTANGRVGIGTSNPAVNLAVLGNIRSYDAGGTSYVNLNHDGVNGFVSTNTGDLYLRATTGVTYVRPTSASSNDIFRVSSSTTNTHYLTVTAGGNVGIGTTSPYAKLSVAGDAVAARFIATTSVASIFPYASTTALSATTLCLTGDSCISSWPSFTDTSFSTTSADYWKSVNDFFSTTSAQHLIATYDKGFFFSTTSADAWKTANRFFSTTSSDYWQTQRNFFSTTSASYFLAQNQGATFSTTSAQYFTHSSTTIPKTYTSNTFTALQTFNSGITSNTLTLGSLNGPLQANNGVVSATSSIGVLYGGTGLTNAPSYGQVLVGNSSGGYTLLATSTLGISGGSSQWTTTGSDIYYNTGNVGIGVNSPSYALTVTASTTGLMSRFYNSATTNGQGLLIRAGETDFGTRVLQVASRDDTKLMTVLSTGNVGIGTTSPASLLSLSGTSGIFASTTATSTFFGGGIDLVTSSGNTGCFAINGTCITGGGASFAYPFPSNATSTLLSFNGGINTNAFTLASYNGPLHANNGAVSATTSIGVLYGGTGLTSAPTYGQMLVGNSSGGYTLMATSSLGISGGSSLFTDGGATTYLTSADNLGLGTTTAGSKLTIFGDIFAEGSNRYLNFGTATGTNGYGFRDNGGVMEFKNAGGTWQGVTTATTGPTFMAVKSATQDINGTPAVVTWESETFDTNGNFASNRFTPTVPGKYLLTLSIYAQAVDANERISIRITKNGSIIALQHSADMDSTRDHTILATVLVDANGSTDYFEALAATNSGATETILNLSHGTYFTGTMIAPVSATAGGWTNDNTQSYLIDTTDKVGIGTTTPWAKLAIQSDAGQSNPVLEVASSSTATKFLSISGTGFGTTTLSGLNISGSATTTSNVGMNITSGCYAINGACLGSGGSAAVGGTGAVQFANGSSLNGSSSFFFDSNRTALGIGTSTPRWALTVASSTGPQLALTDGSLTSSPWTLRSINGNLFFATSSPSTFATSSIAALMINANGTLGIGTSTPVTTAQLDVFGDAILSGSNRYLNFATTTGANGYGFRDNGGVMEFKNAGGTWQGVTTATTGPSFHVHRNSTDQTVTNAVFTLVNWTNASFDTNGNLDLSTDRFQPTVPGKYILNASAGADNPGDAGSVWVEIRKNGTAIAQANAFASAASSDPNPHVTIVADANGTTDYFEVYAMTTGGGALNGATDQTFFTGALISPVNGNNAAGWANDGSASFLLDNADSVGIGTTSPAWKLAVAGSGSFDGFARASYFSATSTTASVFPYASTTAITATTASTTNLIVSGLQDGLLKVGSSGVVSLAVAGTDYSNFAYLFPSNATSTTLSFTGGFLSTASSTFTSSTFFPGGVWGSSGNVGIGTTTPAYRLEVLNTSTTLPGINIGETSTSDRRATIGFGLNPSLTSGWIMGQALGATTVKDFYLHDISTGATRLLIDTSGNFGIGTTQPNSLLHLSSSSPAISLTDNRNFSTPNWIGVQTGGLLWTTADSSAPGSIGEIAIVGNAASGNAPFGDMIFRTGHSAALGQSFGERMRITNTGDIGIGTTSPLAPLHVYNSDARITLQDTATGASAITYHEFRDGNGTRLGFIGDGSSGSADIGIRNDQAGGGIGFSLVGASTAMSISSTGDVTMSDTLSVTGAITEGGSAVLSAANIDTCAEFAALVAAFNSGACGNLVFSASPTFSGTITGVVANFSSNVTTDTAFLTGDSSPINNNAPGSLVHSVGYVMANRSANPSGYFGRTNDGAVVQFYSAGVNEGAISITGSTVTYGAFTGAHYATMDMDETIERGMLVELDGTQTFKHGTSDSEPTYGVRKTSAANSPAVFGSMLSLMEPNKPHDPIENPYLIMAVGNGDMWVVQGDEEAIEPGDYLISSNLAGHAMKDPGTYMVSHIVARAAQKVDWSTVPEAAGMKRTKISVTFEQFDRNAALSDVFAALATPTASSSEETEVQAFAFSFFSNLFSRMNEWLADAGNGIAEIFTKTLRAENVYADTVTANKLCLEDLCVTKAQLQQILNQSSSVPASTPEEPTEEPEAETPSEKPATEEPAQEPEDTPDLEVPEEVPESAPEGSATPPTDDTPEPESAPEAPEEEV